MIIPEKYRERYDRLAASHPWMREMRDEQAPEGDAVELMRDWLDYKINRFDAEANAIIFNTGADPNKLVCKFGQKAGCCKCCICIYRCPACDFCF